MDPESALSSCGGAASWRRLRSLQVSWYSLWRAETERRVVRLRRGAYALPDADAQQAALVALGGVLSCAAAATHLGLPVLVPHRLHLTVPRTWGHARQPGVRVHRRDLREQEHDGLSTSLLRTVLDCARCLPLREAVVVCDAALRAGLPAAALAAAARQASGPGAGAVRRVAGLADAGAESPIESCLRLLATEVARVELQVHIAGVGRVDLLLDGWLVVEADGFEHHASRASYRHDRRRAHALAEQGFGLVRFSYEDVVHHPEYVTRVLRSVLASRPA